MRWKYILIVIILAIIIASGIFAWQYLGVPKEETWAPEGRVKAPERIIEDETVDYFLKSPDGFSLEVYRDQALVKTVSREEILGEFEKKYGDIKRPDIVLPYFHISPPPAFYDTEREQFIVPTAITQVAGATFGWDFLVVNVKTKQVFVASGKRWTSNPEFTVPAGIVPSNFVASPDSKYLAYIVGYAGGTCVLAQRPSVLNLDTFSQINLDKYLDTKEIKKILEKDLETEILQHTKFSTTQNVAAIRWISDNKLVVSMTFGMPGCEPWQIKKEVEFNILP